MNDMLDKQTFRKALRAELESHITLNQPIVSEIFQGGRNWDLLRLIATQGYQLTKHFLTYVEYLFHHCPQGIHKRRLLINLYEEETGALSRTNNHVVLMQNFLRAIGVSDEERDAVQAFPATRELIERRMHYVVNPETFHLGAAAVLIASEGQNLETRAGEARHSLLGQVYGLEESDLLFFSVHQKEDVGHVREGIEVVADACHDAAMQNDALTVVGEVCTLFGNMYAGIGEYYYQHVVPKHSVSNQGAATERLTS
jgi:pyrroloquinoline quinone (PQQ) biosynthesis protein C